MPLDPGIFRLLGDDPDEFAGLLLGPEDERLMFLVKSMSAQLGVLSQRVKMIERMVGIVPMDDPAGVVGDFRSDRSDRGRG